MKIALLLLLLALPALTDESDKCAALQHHGKPPEATACYSALVRSGDALTRAEGYFGLHRYQDANDAFRQADQQHPNSAIIKTAWGSLYLQHDQPRDAAGLFQEALQADSKHAPAYLGLSRALAGGFDKNSVSLAQTALAHDPNLYQAHEFLAYLALEDGDPTAASDEANKALSISSEALDAMAVMAAQDYLKGNGVTFEDSSPWMDKIRKINPYYGEAYDIAGHFLEINYRYIEAIAAYRRALDLEPDLAEARSALGLNLMRLGQTAEAQRQLIECFQEHLRNDETVNSLRFLDTLNQYQDFTTDKSELVLNRKEADLLRPYIQPELELAMATYERKYKIKLPGKVRLEVYPNHDDFVVRTLGLPGQGGLLGVTFGTVVAMDSPSARSAGDFSWADTMWHEMCHVYVITASHNLVPRWFSEGLAVHEEGMASPQWGNRLTPDTVEAIKQKKLLPVMKLDSGFVRPEYPNQVLVSYYQAGQICDFIAQKWGDNSILGMIHSYGAHKTTAEAIADNLGESADAFDREFSEWLNNRTESAVNHLDEWKAAMKAAGVEFQKGNAAGAVEKVVSAQKLFPELPATYRVLASYASTAGKKQDALHALEQYQAHGGTGMDELKQLAQMETEAGRSAEAIAALEEINLVYPEDRESHQKLGALLINQSHAKEAVQEFRAVLALKPADAASAHYDLARALALAHENLEAKDQVLLALEAAPNFKPAQQLLLQLSQ